MKIIEVSGENFATCYFDEAVEGGATLALGGAIPSLLVVNEGCACYPLNTLGSGRSWHS